MRYWPLSEVLRSPVIGPYAAELVNVGPRHPLSQGAMWACSRATDNIKPWEGQMLMLDSLDTILTPIYANYPEFDEWFALERAGFIMTEKVFIFVLNTLH